MAKLNPPSKSLLCFALISSLCACGSEKAEWQAEFQGEGHTYAEGHAITVNAMNQIITTGSTAQENGSPSNGDLFVNAYSNTGEVLWQAGWDDDSFFGTATRTTGQALVTDAEGNTYVAAISSLGNIFDKRLVLHKIDAQGNITWTRIWEGRYGDTQLIHADNTLFLGAYKDSDSGPRDFLTLTAISTDGVDLWHDELEYYVIHITDLTYKAGRLVATANLNNNGLIAAWTSAGQRLWQTEVGTQDSNAEYSGSVLDNDLNVYTVGHEKANPSESTADDNDLVIRKLNASGNPVWQQNYTVDSASSEISKGIGLYQNSVIVGGSTVKQNNGAVNLNGIVVAFDSASGSQKWSKEYDSVGLLTLDTAWDFEVLTDGSSSLLTNVLTVLPPAMSSTVFRTDAQGKALSHFKMDKAISGDLAIGNNYAHVVAGSKINTATEESSAMVYYFK